MLLSVNRISSGRQVIVISHPFLMRDRFRGLPLSTLVKHRSDEGSDPHKGKNLRLEGNFMFAAMESVEVKLNKAKSRA